MHLSSGHLGMMGGEQANTVVAFLDADGSSADSTSFSWTSQNLGTPSSDRYIVVAINNGIANSVVVNSVSLTKLTSYASSNGVSFWGGYVTSGTSGTVAITFASTRFNCGFAMWSVINLNSTTLVSEDILYNQNGTSSTVDITVPSGGFCLVFSWWGTYTSTITWSDNVVKNSDITAGTEARYSGASSSTAGVKSITSSFSTTTGNNIQAISMR